MSSANDLEIDVGFANVYGRRLSLGGRLACVIARGNTVHLVRVRRQREVKGPIAVHGLIAVLLESRQEHRWW